MARKRIVMRIFRRNSGTWKIVMSLFIGLPARRPPPSRRLPAKPQAAVLFRLGLPWLHLVAHRLLRRRDQHRLAARLLDLLLGRRGEVVGMHGQRLRHLALAQHPQVLGGALQYALLLE